MFSMSWKQGYFPSSSSVKVDLGSNGLPLRVLGDALSIEAWRFVLTEKFRNVGVGLEPEPI